MKNDHTYWEKIREFVRSRFHLPGTVYDVLFLIGVRELNYGFTSLDQETKTKVFNFASMYILNFISQEERETLRNQEADSSEAEEHIYRKAIINYFKIKKILDS